MRSLNDRERRAIKWLAERPNACLDRAEVMAATGLSDAEYERLLPMLAQLGQVEQIRVADGIYFSGFQVQPSIPAFARQLDEPPEPSPKAPELTFLQRHTYLGPVIGATISGAVAIALWLLSRK